MSSFSLVYKAVHQVGLVENLQNQVSQLEHCVNLMQHSGHLL
jgi:hypothetical protein